MIATSGVLRFAEQESGGYELAEDAWFEPRFVLPELTSFRDRIKIVNRLEGGKRVSRVYVLDGFEWDGASGPTIDTEGWAWPPFMHDVLYRLMKYGLIGQQFRKPTDNLFRDELLARRPAKPAPLPEGASLFQRFLARPARWVRWGAKYSGSTMRANTWWGAVRIFAGGSAKQRKRPDAHEAR